VKRRRYNKIFPNCHLNPSQGCHIVPVETKFQINTKKQKSNRNQEDDGDDNNPTQRRKKEKKRNFK